MAKIICKALPLLLTVVLMGCGHAGQGNTKVLKLDADAVKGGGEDIKRTDVDSDSVQVKQFLHDFILAFERGRDIALLDSCLTSHAREMYERMVNAHDCDMLVLAQDVPSTFENTLSFACLGHGWYRMEYKDEYSHHTIINHLFVTRDDGGLRIAYVHGFGDGEVDEAIRMDSVFWVKKPEAHVGGGTAFEFLRSFYRAYVAEYLSLDAHVAQGTAMLRERFLSAEAQQQYDAAAQDYADDGQEGFDVLIGDFYTTMKRERDRKIREVAGGLFIVNHRLELSVKPVGDGWIITDMTLRDSE